MTKDEAIGYLSEGGAERLVAKKQAHEQIKNFRLFAHDVPVYTHPPQRTWVGLTGIEVNHVFAKNVGYPERIIKAVENLLKEKNGGK